MSTEDTETFGTCGEDSNGRCCMLGARMCCMRGGFHVVRVDVVWVCVCEAFETKMD